MPQLMTIILNRGGSRNFRWPYHANVIKMLEMVSRLIVVIVPRLPCNRILLPKNLTPASRMSSMNIRKGHEILMRDGGAASSKNFLRQYIPAQRWDLLHVPDFPQCAAEMKPWNVGFSSTNGTEQASI